MATPAFIPTMTTSGDNNPIEALQSDLRRTGAERLLVTPLQLFDDLQRVIESRQHGIDVSGIDVLSLDAKLLIAYCSDGCSIAEGLALVCQHQDAQFREFVFRDRSPMLVPSLQGLAASDGRSTLCLIPTLPPVPTKPIADRALVGDAVVLLTDFTSFVFHRVDATGRLLKSFATFNRSEMCEEIGFNRSAWDLVHPEHYAMVSRTVSYTFAQGTSGALFSTGHERTASLDQERLAFQRLRCLEAGDATLLNLHALATGMQVSPRPPKLLAEYKEGDYTLRQYSPQRSSIFDFGEPATEFSRGDLVTTYNTDGEEFHREFFLAPDDLSVGNEELLVGAFDLLHMLAIRRGKLFRTGFASRVYNVLLPPLLLTEGSRGYALFPSVHLYRTSLKGFRRTLSMSFVACPIDVTTNGAGTRPRLTARRATLDELCTLKAELLSHPLATAGKTRTRYEIGGWRTEYIDGDSRWTIPELVQRISYVVLRRMLNTEDEDPERLIRTALFTASHESRMVTMSLQVDWVPAQGFSQPWERWVSTGNDSVFHNALYRTLFFRDYADPHSADASRHAVRFQDFNIGNTLGADMGGMTLYNPQDTLKLVLYPRLRERYPDYSMVRWMVWQIYIDSALASMRALIYKFHPLLEGRGDLHSIIHTLDEMIQEFVDFYDLDIRDYFYRIEYEKLRALMQVDADYAQLLSKFSSSKEDESLREQRLINKLIVSLTIATVTTTIVSTVAQTGALSISRYLVVALVLSTLMVWVGYVIFDPVRRRFVRGNVIARRLSGPLVARARSAYRRSEFLAAARKRGADSSRRVMTAARRLVGRSA